jgi:serine/threonine-protein kinase HipA
MVTAAFVSIWGKRVGAISWNDSEGVASFQYDPDFLTTNQDLAPFMMPISQGNRVYTFPNLRNNDTFKGLPGLIADTLPDNYGNQLINAWLLKNNRPANSMNPVEQLCFIGERGMGALTFEPTKMPKQVTNFSLEIDSLVSIAQKVLGQRKLFTTNLHEDDQQALKDLLKIGTSAGGARPKAIISFNETTGEVKSGQANVDEGFEHWLLKLDGVSDAQFGTTKGYGRVEMAYYLMAKDCGIDMMECRLLEENGRAHFMTKRFDRTKSGEKHHIQTFCALRHYDFNEVNSFSYEQLFETMRILRLPYPQAEQLYRRMVFNVIAKNCDDHTKNFAFRMKQGEAWELAPAYDICYAYRPGSIWVSQHALSINGKRANFTRNDLISIADSMNIKKPNHIIDHIIQVVHDWPKYAKRVNISAALKKSIGETLVRL